MPWTTLTAGTLTVLADATIDAQLGQPLGGVRAFMKGDGHRNPPFQWFNTCPRLQLHLQNLMFAEMLCAHVEQHQEDVDGPFERTQCQHQLRHGVAQGTSGTGVFFEFGNFGMGVGSHVRG